jgi:integrase/recombinase XerD
MVEGQLHINRHDGGSSSNQQEEDPNFDRKLDLITAGASPFVKEHLLTKISRENCQVIVNYILAFSAEVSPSEGYRIDTIQQLKMLSEFHNSKPFKDMTRDDVLAFLDRLRKSEIVDPLHKWKGSYEITRILLLRFFKWLYYPDIQHKKRPKPEVVQNINKIKRLETSIYKPTDLWTEEDDAIFYKYCPSPRDKCFWAMLRDTGCRVHELLKLKIKDIVIERLDSGYHSARITVNGKTGTRHVTITNSYPYLKDWISHGHPYGSNPNSYLFVGYGRKTGGKRIQNSTSIHWIYAHHYKNVVFPRVLQDPLAPEEDKRKIRDLLQKPWNPHARRHTAATEVSKAFKDAVLIDQYMGWSPGGNTRVKYQHYFSDDAHIAKLEADGFLPEGSFSSKNKIKGLLKPKPCPNCAEPNKPDSRFCAKCKFVLSFDAFNEAVKYADEKEKELEKMQQNQQRMWDNMMHMQNIIDSLFEQMKTGRHAPFPEAKDIMIGLKRGHKQQQEQQQEEQKK